MVQSDNSHDEAAPPEIDPEQLSEIIGNARKMLRQGDRAAAVDLCLRTLDDSSIEISAVTAIYSILRDAGRDDLANVLGEQLRRVTAQIARDRPDDAHQASQSALVHLELGDLDDALVAARRARAIEPANFDYMMLHCLCMVKADRYDLNDVKPEPVLANVQTPATALAAVAVLLGNFDRPDDALVVLDLAMGLCRSESERVHLDTLRSGVTGEVDDSKQRELATGIFDKFADSYDEKLQKLGNNGPALIAVALELARIPADGALDVFDAGCGTGLCAPVLRPFARHLHGADLSIPMLEKCRAKGTFDLLTRTDLAVRDTFPDATFDMIVSGDVLVYFGALDAVFTNFRDVLRPGGRVIFTVEEARAPDPETGFRATPSGRKAHSEAYLRRMLAATGFPHIDLIHRETLRFEFGQPIPGLVVVARRDS